MKRAKSELTKYLCTIFKFQNCVEIDKRNKRLWNAEIYKNKQYKYNVFG